jgi:hypothetical protein
MSARTSISRREVASTIAGGALLGAIWGAAFPALATERRPTLAVIGKQTSQLTLLDSGLARALIISGEPDDDLFERLPAVMTVFRQRMDLIIGGSPILVARAKELADRWRARHAIVLSGSRSAPSLPMSSTVVSDVRQLSLGNEMSLQIRIGHRHEWRAATSSRSIPLWGISIHSQAARIAIAPDLASFLAVPPEPSSLLVAPDKPGQEMFTRGPAKAVAVNYDSSTLDPPPEGVFVTRIYPRDIARFVFGEEGLELPPWTTGDPTNDEMHP